MSRNILQVFTANPITTNAATDLMYFGQSPYGVTNDAGMTYANFAAQFGAAYTASALTATPDTNVTISLGGTPATALLHAASITLGWTGTLSPARGGTGVNNGTSTITIGGNFAMAGAFTFTGTLTGNTAVTFPTSGTLATTSQIPTGAALTKTDDTNVTLTLAGSPATALVNAASLTLGWTGSLAVGRGGLGITTTPANGAVPIGNGTNYTSTTITAGTNISVTNGSGSITIAATGTSAFAWNNVAAGTQAMAVNQGYITNNGASLVTYTLPSTAAQGSIFSVAGTSAGGWKINQNASQVVHIGNQTTTTGTGGSLASTNQWDQVSLLCVTANTTFVVLNSIGNITVV